jgi:charged multivesicular body protein 1
MSRRMYDIIFDLKFQAKQLNRSAQKCASNEKQEKDKAFKAMQKNNMEGARIHAQNAIRLHNENLHFLRIASQCVFLRVVGNHLATMM